MDISMAVPLAIGLGFIVLLVYLANQEDLQAEANPLFRWMLYGAVGLMVFVILPVFTAVLGSETSAELGLQIDPGAALLVIVWGIAAILLSLLVIQQYAAVLQFIKRLVGSAGYNPQSNVHNTALILMLMLLTMNFAIFVLGGGLSGYAESLEGSGISPFEPLFLAALEIALAFLGVGMALRRSPVQSLERLGLVVPSVHEVVRGIAAGIGLYIFLIIFVTVWQGFSAIEEIDQQTQASQQVAMSFATLPLALIASASAALGEEIFIRGALQPIFGLVPTSIFFALLHTQYLITPGLLLIVLIAIGLGLLRQRYNTTTAIIAHFVYNFIQLFLFVLVVSAGVS